VLAIILYEAAVGIQHEERPHSHLLHDLNYVLVHAHVLDEIRLGCGGEGGVSKCKVAPASCGLRK